MTSSTVRGFGQKQRPIPEAGPADVQPRRPAAPSTRVAGILARHDWLVLAAQAVWLLAIVLHLGDAFMPTAPLHHDDLLPVIDVPKDVAADLLAQGHPLPTAATLAAERLFRGLPMAQPLVPGLGSHYFPALGFMVYIEWLGLTAIVAALRRQWTYYFVLVALMAVPGEILGASVNMVTVMAGAATIAAVVAAIRSRQFKLLGAAIAAFVALTAWQSYNLNVDMSTPVIPMPQANASTSSIDDYDDALTSAATRYPAAVAYVRAQAAYSEHNWSRIQAIGPIDGQAFGNSPFKTARLKTLAQTLHDLGRPAGAPLERPALSVFVARLQAGLALLAIALSLLAWHIRRRSRRVAALEAKLSPVAA